MDINMNKAVEQAMQVADQTLEQKRKLIQTAAGKTKDPAQHFPTARNLLLEKKRYA